MKFLWRHVLLLAALMAGALLLAACGGEEKLDLDQYFRGLDDIVDTADTRVDTLMDEAQGVGEETEATRVYFEGFEAIFEQTLNDLNDLHPPAEVRDAHDEFVAALAAGLAVWEDFSTQLADVESPSGLKTLLAEFELAFDAAAERLDNACLQLQGIADQNAIEIDLECE